MNHLYFLADLTPDGFVAHSNQLTISAAGSTIDEIHHSIRNTLHEMSKNNQLTSTPSYNLELDKLTVYYCQLQGGKFVAKPKGRKLYVMASDIEELHNNVEKTLNHLFESDGLEVGPDDYLLEYKDISSELYCD